MTGQELYERLGAMTEEERKANVTFYDDRKLVTGFPLDVAYYPAGGNDEAGITVACDAMYPGDR